MRSSEIATTRELCGGSSLVEAGSATSGGGLTTSLSATKLFKRKSKSVVRMSIIDVSRIPD
jgi:hypothetical protein